MCMDRRQMQIKFNIIHFKDIDLDDDVSSIQLDGQHKYNIHALSNGLYLDVNTHD